LQREPDNCLTNRTLFWVSARQYRYLPLLLEQVSEPICAVAGAANIAKQTINAIQAGRR
jgi:hypothetical protein